MLKEIICYFDTEKTAYDYEEWLISIYGLESEGGVLTNYAKTRFEYSDKFAKDVSSQGHKHRAKKYSDNQVLRALRLYFEDCFNISDTSKETGIPRTYLSYCLRGLKNKSLYEENVGVTINKNRDYKADNCRYKHEYVKPPKNGNFNYKNFSKKS